MLFLHRSPFMIVELMDNKSPLVFLLFLIFYFFMICHAPTTWKKQQQKQRY